MAGSCIIRENSDDIRIYSFKNINKNIDIKKLLIFFLFFNHNPQ